MWRVPALLLVLQLALAKDVQAGWQKVCYMDSVQLLEVRMSASMTT